MPRNSRNTPMNSVGWWANTTVSTRNATCAATSGTGTRFCNGPVAGSRLRSSRRNSSIAPLALIATAIAAFQPKFIAMNGRSQPQAFATISTGGAAKFVSVPPMEMFTNNTPKVAYLKRADTCRLNRLLASTSAASVMAAGSVMNEPSRGTTASTTKYSPMLPSSGSSRDKPLTTSIASCRIGRLPAITMMTNTNNGSVKLRDSTYSVAAGKPLIAARMTTNTIAQKPNTTSTSPSRCHRPAWRGFARSRRANCFTENVCTIATPNSTAAISSITLGFMGDSFRRCSLAAGLVHGDELLHAQTASGLSDDVSRYVCWLAEAQAALAHV